MADAQPPSPAHILTDATLRYIYDYWRAKKSTRRFPLRREMSPTDLPANVLPHVMLLDLLWHGAVLQIRIRLSGTHIDDAFGRSATGETISPALLSNRNYVDYLQALYTELVRTAASIYSENVFRLAGQSVPMLTKRLSLPLSTDGAVVDMALVGVVFEYPARSDPQYAQKLNEFSETVRQVLPV